MPVMLQNISAAPLPAAHAAAANAVRSVSSRPDRDGNSDNNFSSALRGAHDDDDARNVDADRGTDAKAAQPAKPADRSDRKDVPLRKRNSKDEDTNEQSAKAAVPTQPLPQRNDAPLAALLNLVSYRGPAEATEQKAGETPAAVNGEPAADAAVTAATTPLNDRILPALGAATKIGETQELAGTSGRTPYRGHGMTVPLDYYPILPGGSGWGTAASALATSTVNSSAASAAAVAVSSSPSDPLVLNAPPASDAAAPELSPKSTAFAMRVTPESQQPTRQAEASAGTPSTQKFSLGSPSIAALEQTANNGGKSQSNDTSSGQHSGFGMAYAEPALDSRSATDKPVFAEATSAARTAATDETILKPATADPLRNILLQLKSDDNRRIDVRLVERAGELHVAVKSADPVLAERLQQNMPELTSRLEAEHFTHEIWMPKLSEAGRSESGSNSDNTSAGSNGQPGQSLNSDAGRRQHGQSQSRPDWVDLLENQIG